MSLKKSPCASGLYETLKDIKYFDTEIFVMSLIILALIPSLIHATVYPIQTAVRKLAKLLIGQFDCVLWPEPYVHEYQMRLYTEKHFTRPI